MFHSNWVISDYHSFVWQFEFPWLNLTNCRNEWMVIRNDPVTVKHVYEMNFQTLERWWWHLFWLQILISLRFWAKWPFFGSLFHASGVFGIWYEFTILLQQRLHPLGTATSCNSGHANTEQTCQRTFHRGPSLWIRACYHKESWGRGGSYRGRGNCKWKMLHIHSCLLQNVNLCVSFTFVIVKLIQVYDYRLEADISMVNQHLNAPGLSCDLSK